MQSIWHDLARQWLGGEVSEALSGDLSFLDRFPIGAEATPPVFQVRRVDGVSHTAMLHDSPLPSAALTVD